MNAKIFTFLYPNSFFTVLNYDYYKYFLEKKKKKKHQVSIFTDVLFKAIFSCFSAAFLILGTSYSYQSGTRHNTADSLPTSYLVCLKEVAIRNTFSYMINIAGIIYYTCSVVIDILITRYKNAFNKRF